MTQWGTCNRCLNQINHLAFSNRGLPIRPELSYSQTTEKQTRSLNQMHKLNVPSFSSAVCVSDVNLILWNAIVVDVVFETEWSIRFCKITSIDSIYTINVGSFVCLLICVLMGPRKRLDYKEPKQQQQSVEINSNSRMRARTRSATKYRHSFHFISFRFILIFRCITHT